MDMKQERAEYLQPPMRMAGSFGDIAELEYMLTAYFHLRVIEPWDLETIKAKVRKCAAACHFSDDSEEWEFDAYAAMLYRTVCELKHSPIRTGLAEGPLPAGEARVEYLALLAHEGYGASGELLRFFADAEGYTPEELCEHPGLMTEAGQTCGQFYDALLDRLRALFAVMDAEDYSRASAYTAAKNDACENRAALTDLLLRVAAEATEYFAAERMFSARCEWPRRMRTSFDDAEEIRRRFRSEAMNPLFIEGVAAHGRRGAMALAAYVARSCQWDALCHGLDGWMYEALARTYALHPAVQRWLRESCPGALRHLTGSLIAATRGSRWRASLKTRTELSWLYRSLEQPKRIRRERAKANREQA